MAKHNQPHLDTPVFVEQTVANHGSWDAVAFLLISHQVTQADYEAWRIGEYPELETCIINDLPHTIAMLDRAVAYARSMGMISEPTTWSQWNGTTNQTLRLFHDEATNQRFQIRLTPKSNRRQLDLFMDAPHTVLLNRLRQAMLNRSSDVESLFQRAQRETPNHPTFQQLKTVRSALASTTINDPVAWCKQLQSSVAPAAKEAFPHNYVDITAPLWRATAAAMHAIPFHSDHPDCHASFALLQAHDFEATLAAIESIASWWLQPSLHDRRIAALSAMHNHEDERAAWILYCWCCPDEANTALAQAELHRCGLHGVWQQFTKLQEPQPIETFPALIALRNGFNPDAPAIFSHAQQTLGWQYYHHMTSLLHNERHGKTDIAMRRTLKASSPWLFQSFMASQPLQK